MRLSGSSSSALRGFADDRRLAGAGISGHGDVPSVPRVQGKIHKRIVDHLLAVGKTDIISVVFLCRGNDKVGSLEPDATFELQKVHIGKLPVLFRVLYCQGHVLLLCCSLCEKSRQ